MDATLGIQHDINYDLMCFVFHLEHEFTRVEKRNKSKNTQHSGWDGEPAWGWEGSAGKFRVGILSYSEVQSDNVI